MTNSHSNGLVEGRPIRYLYGHQCSKGKGLSNYIVDPVTGCWEWQGATIKNGYAVLTMAGKWQLAHRASYESVKGAIPAGLDLDHLCRNRPCINPDHLEPVTRTTNARRGAKCKASGVSDAAS